MSSIKGQIVTILVFVSLLVSLYACMLSCVWLFVTLWTVACPAPLSMDSPGKNTGVGCHCLLQRIFPTQRLNPYLLHWQEDSLPLSHQESYSLLQLPHSAVTVWKQTPRPVWLCSRTISFHKNRWVLHLAQGPAWASFTVCILWGLWTKNGFYISKGF